MEENLNKSLIEAVHSCNVRNVEECISSGANVNTVDDVLGTPLNIAVRGGCKKCVQLLLTSGASVNVVELADARVQQLIPLEPPLINAIKGRNIDLIELLLDAGADVNCTNRLGWTAVCFTVLTNNRNAVELLVRYGADINKLSDRTIVDNDVFPLGIAAGEGYSDLVTYLIHCGARLNTQGVVRGWSALMESSREGHNGCVEILISAGADVNLRSLDMGKSALHLSADYLYSKTVKLLLLAGADFNAVDTYGDTPLSSCIKHLKPSQADNKNIVQDVVRICAILLESGCNVNYCVGTYNLFKHHVYTNLRNVELVTKLMFAAGETFPASVGHCNMPDYWSSFVYPLDEIQLSNVCRNYIRKYLLHISRVNLFWSVHRLCIPEVLRMYIIYDVSLENFVMKNT